MHWVNRILLALLAAGIIAYWPERLELASSSEDLERVARERDELVSGNDALREEILPLAQFAPFEAQATFFIFPRADISFPETVPGAANALLKTLEEPRPAVHFILLAERPDKLLSTIRSRCQRVRFYPLPHAQLDAILAKHDIAPELRGPAIALSGGSAERALRLSEDGVADRLLKLAFQVDDVTRGVWPFMLAQFALLLLMVLFPQLVIWPARLLGG